MQYKLLALQFPLWDCHTPLFLHKYCTQSFKKRFLSLKSQNRRVTAFQLASSADIESRSKENQQHPHCFNRNTASKLWEPIIPHAALTRHTSILHSGWVPKIKRQMSINWSKFPGGPPNWPHAGAFTLWGDARGACSACGRDSVGGSPNRVYRRYQQEGARLFTVDINWSKRHSDWIKGITYFQWRQYSTESSCAASTLAVFQGPTGYKPEQPHLPHSWPCFEQELGLENSRGHFNLNYEIPYHRYSSL